MAADAGTDGAAGDQRARFEVFLRGRVGNAPVRIVETHVSILGMGPDRVWKLKKAVRFPFVDLSTVALRRQNAERELAVNRRFAPDVYLGIVPLDDAKLGGDVVVEMRRMPDPRRLAAVAGGPDASDCVDAIADALVEIHRRAPAGPEIDRAGTVEAVRARWERNAEEMQPFAPSVLDAEALTRVTADARRYLTGRGALFARRVAAGRIRDGHGDLLADDVFCLDDGPRFLDALEFDDELRHGDVLADVAFLAMDLERLGHRDLSDRLLDRYRATSGDDWPDSLADFYVAYRALVRSKVACLRGATDQARALLALAQSHLRDGRVRLVLVGGPPATGKSTLARELGRRTGWPVLHSDEVRKRLAGLDPTTPAAAGLDAGLYTSEWSARTYDALLAAARPFLEGGCSVVLDASWGDEDRRRAAGRLAQECAADDVSFRLTVPAAVADARARARAASRTDASDAGPSVTEPLRARFAPWPDATALDATRPVDELARDVFARLEHGA